MTSGVYVRTEEHKRKVSEALIGDKSYNWKGGRSPYKYIRIRKSLKPEDICEHCGTNEGKICTHHIDGDHTNNTIENLKVLCQVCHNKVHWSQGDFKRR